MKGFVIGQINGEWVQIPIRHNKPSDTYELNVDEACSFSLLDFKLTQEYTLCVFAEAVGNETKFVGQVLEKDICVQGDSVGDAEMKAMATIKIEKEAGYLHKVEPAPDKFFKAFEEPPEGWQFIKIRV